MNLEFLTLKGIQFLHFTEAVKYINAPMQLTNKKQSSWNSLVSLVTNKAMGINAPQETCNVVCEQAHLFG